MWGRWVSRLSAHPGDAGQSEDPGQTEAYCPAAFGVLFAGSDESAAGFQGAAGYAYGNPIYLDSTKILYYRTETKGLSLYSIGAFFSNFLTLNADYTLHHSKLDDVDPMRARTCDMTYGDYDYSGSVPFSTYRRYR